MEDILLDNLRVLGREPGCSVRVAAIGCGYWGKNLVRYFAELGALAAICDPTTGPRRRSSPIVITRRSPNSRSVADVTLAKHLLDYEAKVESRAGLKTLAVS
jgi:hypothetical protein